MYYVPDTVPGMRDRLVNKMTHRAKGPAKPQRNKHIV